MTQSLGGWSDVHIAGHLAHAYEPKDSSPKSPVVVYLHSEEVESPADHAVFGELFARHGLRCLAPVTGRSWWTDRTFTDFDASISVERYVTDRVVPWLAEKWGAGPPQLALLGVGMGGQGVLRLAYKHPNLFPVAAAISPTIDYQVRLEEGDENLRRMYRDAEQARQDTATLHIHPLNWPRHQWFCCDPTDWTWHESADRLRMKLYSLGVPYQCDLETSGGGHNWSYFERMAEPAMQFIAARLEQERLRVP